MRAEGTGDEPAEAAEEEANNETGKAADSAGEINLGRMFRRRRRGVGSGGVVDEERIIRKDVRR